MSQAEKSNVVNIPPTKMTKELLEKLIGECSSYKAEMDTSRSNLGNAIKGAEDTYNLERGAFKLAMKLKNMEPVKRAAFLKDFRLYAEWLGLDNQPDLPLEGEGG